jgi:DNA-binding transcriptional ArsR family regulator
MRFVPNDDVRQRASLQDVYGDVDRASRLRHAVVMLLSRAELTVTEISRVIGQSQPRTSRHLRLIRSSPFG